MESKWELLFSFFVVALSDNERKCLHDDENSRILLFSNTGLDGKKRLISLGWSCDLLSLSPSTVRSPLMFFGLARMTSLHGDSCLSSNDLRYSYVPFLRDDFWLGEPLYAVFCLSFDGLKYSCTLFFETIRTPWVCMSVEMDETRDVFSLLINKNLN